MKLIKILFIIAAAMIINSCSQFIITPVNFAWPLESVFDIDSTGTVEEQRYAFTFNAVPLLEQESDSTKVISKTKLRIIRGEKGFYYITAENFKHVYIFSPGEGELLLKTKILLSEEGIHAPAFNQRAPFVQLLFGDEQSVFINSEGIVEETE
jgi:hypothetical protein